MQRLPELLSRGWWRGWWAGGCSCQADTLHGRQFILGNLALIFLEVLLLASQGNSCLCPARIRSALSIRMLTEKGSTDQDPVEEKKKFARPSSCHHPVSPQHEHLGKGDSVDCEPVGRKRFHRGIL